jgi:zinc/manganese transport system ATP-binding protein
MTLQTAAPSTVDSAAISLDHATLSLGGRTVLRDVNLTIAAGEFIGVFGPNGAGKTTLMRALLGIIRPVAGSVRVFGRPAGVSNADIGYMPQHRNLAAGATLTGWDFVACTTGGNRWGLPLLSAAARSEVERVLEIVGATALARRPLSELSGGERQQLLLAQALTGRPRLLLLDEPLLNLDPPHQHMVVKLANQLKRDLGLTVLLSAHELNPLLDVLDRVLYLGRGQAALGSVSDVITGPVLSALYGAPIDVLHANGHIFVMSGGHDLEREVHRHGSHSHRTA